MLCVLIPFLLFSPKIINKWQKKTPPLRLWPIILVHRSYTQYAILCSFSLISDLLTSLFRHNNISLSVSHVWKSLSKWFYLQIAPSTGKWEVLDSPNTGAFGGMSLGGWLWSNYCHLYAEPALIFTFIVLVSEHGLLEEDFLRL